MRKILRNSLLFSTSELDTEFGSRKENLIYVKILL